MDNRVQELQMTWVFERYHVRLELELEEKDISSLHSKSSLTPGRALIQDVSARMKNEPEVRSVSIISKEKVRCRCR